MKKRLVSLLLVGVMAAGMLAGCGGSDGQDSKGKEEGGESSGEVAISFYTTETGKDDYFQDLIQDFESKNEGITVEYIAAGDDQLQAWMALYSSNEGPTVSLMDPINIYENQERMLDLTDQSLLGNVKKDSLSTLTFDGKVYGVPMSAAGIGILYNKAVCDKAVGGDFDPATIKTRSDLKDLLDKIEKTGVAGSCITGVNWSIGAHYLCQVYGAAIGDVEERVEYVNSIISGDAKEIDNEVFNGYMDTFELLAEHNLNKADPLVGDVNVDAAAFAEGKCGTWFMGDWAWTYLAEIVEEGAEFGLLPIPYSDDENDTINQCIPTSYAKGCCIDISQNTEEQQQAGLKFIEYMSSDEYALEQTAVVTGQALPFENFAFEEKLSPLGQSTASYMSEGRAYDFYGTPNLCPSDIWYECGAYMCEYLSGACDRETLASKIDGYWGTQEAR
ncbi:MAG: carbohydrate ABC transporter substrate-binding protein [Dorea sp.]|nr:carbohydrate ABC transporter substrate-binding protein [Dorea sp.]